MVLVVRAFRGPFEDFALDDAGVGAVSAYRVDTAQEFGDALIPQSGGGVLVMRGKRAVGQGSSGYPQGGDERDPVRVVTAGGRGVAHQGADGVVAAQVPPDFLQDQRWGFRPQDRSWSALVGFQFVEGVLDFPALSVGQG